MKQARALRRVVIKEEFIALAGDHVGAVLLNQIEYWTKHSRDFDKYLAEEKRRASKDGRELDVALTHGWIYKTAQDLSEETMMNMSPSNIRMRLKKLIKRGWISERNNPDHKWDQTKQYRFNASRVAADLEELGYHLDGWVFEDLSFKADASSPKERLNSPISILENGISILENRFSVFENRTIENRNAIPEITTETKDQQQQPEADLADRECDGKDVVADDDTPESISTPEPVPHGPAQCEIQELIDFARDRPQEIILSIDYAGEIIRRAGGLGTAKEKIEAASSFIAREHKAGREINSIKGVMNRIMDINTGGIKLGRNRADEKRKRRLAEKEEKYKDIYVS